MGNRMENKNRSENTDPVKDNPPKADGDHAFQADRTSGGIDPERSREGSQRASASYGIDKERRRFLTVMLIGSGAFLAEKVLGPLFSFFSDPSARSSLSNKPGSRGFNIVENKNGLSVYDVSGEEILQIDKES